MAQATRNFEFTVTLHPVGEPKKVFTKDVKASDDLKARKAARENDEGVEYTVLSTHCDTPRWRREFGHAILSEKEIDVGGQKCLEVETEYAVVLVGPEDVYASVSKTKREAMYWGVFASKKYRRLRGHAAMWLMTQPHRVGRKGTVKPEARTTRQTCGGEIYTHAATGVTHLEEALERQAEFAAKEEEGRAKLQTWIDAGEFDPKNFDSYSKALCAFNQAKFTLGIHNGPFFMRLYPAPSVEAAV